MSVSKDDQQFVCRRCGDPLPTNARFSNKCGMATSDWNSPTGAPVHATRSVIDPSGDPWTQTPPDTEVSPQMPWVQQRPSGQQGPYAPLLPPPSGQSVVLNGPGTFNQ